MKRAQVNLGRFELGSPSSRAAVRVLIERRQSESAFWDTVLVSEECREPRFGEWKQYGASTFTRSSIIPAHMPFDQALHLSGLAPVNQYSKYTRILVPERIGTTASEHKLTPEF